MNRTLLIIDDRKVESVTLSGFIQDFYNLITASSDSEAISILNNQASTFSVILLNLINTDYNGLKLLKSIKTNTIWCDIPIIVITNIEDSSLREKALEYDVYDFITKPYNKNFILHTLKNAVYFSEATNLSKRLWYDQQFESIMSSINGGVSVTYIDNGKPVFIVINDQYYKQIGYTKEQFEKECNNDKYALIHPDDRERVIQQYTTISGNKKRYTMEYRIIRRNGEIRYLQNNISIIDIFGIEQPVMFSVANDITNLRLAQQKNIDSYAKLKAIMTQAGNGITAVAITGNSTEFLFANDKYYELFGSDKKAPEFSGIEEALAPIHADDKERVFSLISESNTTQKDSEFEYRIVRKDDSIIWIKTVITYTKLINIESPVQIATYTDITAEKVANEQLVFLNESAHDILVQSDTNEAINKTLEKLLNYFESDRAYVIEIDNKKRVTNNTYEVCAKGIESEIELLQNVPFKVSDYWFAILQSNDFIIIDDVKELDDDKKELRELLEQQNISSLMIAALLNDGKLIGFAGIDNPRVSRNQLTHLSALCDYIAILLTKRDMKAQVNQKESQLTLLTSSIPGGIASYLINHNKVETLYINDGFFKSQGYTREEYLELTKHTPLDLMYEPDRAIIRDVFDSIKKSPDESKVIDLVYRCLSKTNEIRWMNMKGRISKQNNGSFILNVVQLDITDQKKAEDNLHLAEEEYRLATKHSGSTICRFDIKTRTLTVTSEAAQRLELPEVISDIPYGRIKLGRISPDTTEAYTKFYEDIINGQKEGTVIFQKKLPKGWRWIQAQSTTLFTEDGKPVSAIISYIDITEQQEKEAVYKKWSQSLEERNDNSYTLIRCNLSKNDEFVNWQGNLLSKELCKLKQPFNERTKEYASKYVFSEDRDIYISSLNSDTLLANYYRHKRNNTVEYREQQSDGTTRWLKLSIDLVEYPNSTDIEVFLLYENIDEQKKQELLTLHRSQIDSLTGVLNREAFISQFKQIMFSSDSSIMHSFLMLDVDNFKHVNDTYGHETGDRVLRELTEGIRKCLRKNDLLGRLGGDEFFILLRDVPNKELIAKKATQICKQKIIVGSNEQITISMGIVIIPKDGNDFDTLYKKVDDTLYKKKNNGKSGYLFAEE